jgi:8-oxo-dGTP pyrophosphatase MutT (NUDIX family)
MSKVQAAGVFLVRKDGKLLVCHPTNHAPTFWSIPKGKIDEGETPLQAAIRETFEECNVSLIFNEKNLIELEPVNYGHKKKMIFPYVFFEAKSDNLDWSKFDIKCNSNVPLDRGGFPEMDDFKWVTLKEASELLHETQVACLDKIESIYTHFK